MTGYICFPHLAGNAPAPGGVPSRVRVGHVAGRMRLAARIAGEAVCPGNVPVLP